MGKIYNSVLELIGNTPMVKLDKIKEKFSLKANLFAKIEGVNPAGSVKDRVALNMILQAEKQGKLTKGGTIIEPTSGNTGIGIAMIGKIKGYNVIIVMPSNMSEERIKLIKAYGAKVELTESSLGMKGAIQRAEEINKSTPNSIIAGQFNNMANPQAHYFTTGPEIFSDLNGNIDAFVAGIGTGGTISGVGEYLKGKNPKIKVFGLEPLSSPLITQNMAGAHKIQGIGANFIPETLNLKVIDKVFTISNEDAITFGREATLTEGLFVGISSGAVLALGVQLAMLDEFKDKNIVLLFPDSGYKYLSTELLEN